MQQDILCRPADIPCITSPTSYLRFQIHSNHVSRQATTAKPAELSRPLQGALSQSASWPFPPLKSMRPAARRGENYKMKHLLLELKVCEGCGMLWLRRKETQNQHADGNYCPSCVQRLSSFPVRGKHAGGRPRSEAPRSRTRRNRGCAAAKAGAR